MRETLDADRRRTAGVLGVLCFLLYANWLFAVARFQPNVMFMD